MATSRAGLYRRIIDSLPLAVFLLDEYGIIRHLSGDASPILGLPRKEILDTPFLELLPPEDAFQLERRIGRARGGENDPLPVNHRVLGPMLEGTTFETHISPFQPKKGESYRVLLISRPIPPSDEESAVSLTSEVEELRREVERYALSIEGTSDGLWDWDLNTGKVFVSDRSCKILGYAEGEIGDDSGKWIRLIHEEDRPEFIRRLRDHFKGENRRFDHEHRMKHKDGNPRWVLTRGIAVRDAEGRANRMVGFITDISLRKAFEEQLQHEALHDALTGLPNQVLFLNRIQQRIDRFKRYPETLFAVLFMDLDRFKVINDSLGHETGDQLLVKMAQRLREQLRPEDTVARLGGDEYGILLDEVKGVPDTTGLVKRIQESLSLPFYLDGREVYTSASIGLAMGGSDVVGPEHLVRDADTAMYHAKEGGRARHAVFAESMHTKAVAEMELEMDLRRATENKDFRLHYQPIVSLQSGTISGFEALIRWHHPKRGFISPGEFIPLAEETGLIYDIGLWTLKEACRQIRSWQSKFPAKTPLFMSINISGIQFLRPELIMHIDLILREHGLNPKTIKLEITESVIIEHAQYASDMLTQLKAQNIRLSIDDFGTGYSSLSNLRKYPIDTVKVDQSFVRKMLHDDESLEIIRTVTTMAHNLKMDVIAEGIETHDQLVRIRALKCDYGQGFLFAKGLDSDAAENLLRRNQYW